MAKTERATRARAGKTTDLDGPAPDCRQISMFATWHVCCFRLHRKADTDMRPRDLFDFPTRRRYAREVRTILAIDDDVLEAARCIADEQGVSVGDVISRLARSGLEPDRTRRRFPTFTVAPGPAVAPPPPGEGPNAHDLPPRDHRCQSRCHQLGSSPSGGAPSSSIFARTVCRSHRRR